LRIDVFQLGLEPSDTLVFGANRCHVMSDEKIL
jgi:hypothetical protein